MTTCGVVGLPPSLERPIAEAVRISGISRSEIYRALGDGTLEAVKRGSRTLILMASLRT